jgi:hypothetical protein
MQHDAARINIKNLKHKSWRISEKVQRNYTSLVLFPKISIMQVAGNE